MQKTEDERWDQGELDLAVGLPWEPIPGRGQIQVKSKVKFMEESGDNIREPFEWEEPKSRRMHINKEDVKRKYGAVQGCRGCDAALRGGDPRPHNERCRALKEQLMQKKEPERYNAALEKMVEEMEKKKRSRSDRRTEYWIEQQLSNTYRNISGSIRQQQGCSSKSIIRAHDSRGKKEENCSSGGERHANGHCEGCQKERRRGY